jgi:hypothetical protein
MTNGGASALEAQEHRDRAWRAGGWDSNVFLSIPPLLIFTGLAHTSFTNQEFLFVEKTVHLSKTWNPDAGLPLSVLQQLVSTFLENLSSHSCGDPDVVL